VIKKPAPPTLDQRRAQWLKGVLDLCVLVQLRCGEAYGYELARALEGNGFGVIKGGTLYPLLNRLERDGLVTTVWRASDQGPDRKYYRITELGVTELEAARIAWSDFVAAAQSTIAASELEPT
jgi:PadR family transcriptional regulator PadR